MAAAPFGCCVKSRRGSFHLPGGSLFRYGRNMLPSVMAEPKKRGRGRPRTGRDPMYGLRMSDDLVAAVDEWAAQQPDAPSRSEAIRRLVQLGLTVRPDEGDSPKPHGDKLAVPAGRAAGGRRTVRLGEPEEPDEQ